MKSDLLATWFSMLMTIDIDSVKIIIMTLYSLTRDAQAKLSDKSCTE